MVVELRELSLNDGIEIYEMIQEIGPGENGYQNRAYGLGFQEFQSFLSQSKDESLGINLQPQYVPQTVYWLLIDGKPVGIGKLRSHLNDNLRKIGGHIGYTIRPTERGKGYGNIILAELLKKVKEKGINEVLVTCAESNFLSRKIIQSNNGELEATEKGECRYWIRRF